MAGWVVAASTATDSRAVFYLADQPGSAKRLKVDYRGMQPPVSESVVPTVGSWPGRYVIVTGSFDGNVFETSDLVIRNDHPYRESTSQPVSP